MKVEYYTGVLDHKKISFSRYYQNHRFTDAECEKLINGETIQIYDLESHGTPYGVEGQLRCKVFPGIAKPIESYSFVRTKILSHGEENGLHYDTNREAVNKNVDSGENVILPKQVANEKTSQFLDIFSDELDRKTIDVLEQNPVTSYKKKETVDVFSGLSYLDQIILEERNKRKNKESRPNTQSDSKDFVNETYESYEPNAGFDRVESNMSELEHDASFDEGMDRYSDSDDDVMDYDFEDESVPNMFQSSDTLTDDVIAE